MNALPVQQILEVAHSHGAVSVKLFGSWATGNNRADSDLDLLVQLEADCTLLDLIAIQQDLEDLLGISVDVVSENGLSPFLRERILAEARPLQAA